MGTADRRTARPARRRSRTLRGGLIATLLLAAAALTPPAAAQARRAVTFGVSVGSINASYCMFPTALRLGFFAEEGLDVRVQPIPGAVTVLQTVLSGRLEIGGTTPEPVYQLLARGSADLVMIYNFIRRPTGSLAVLDDSPIRALADFRNKKLGVQSLASSNILLTNGVLAKLGINPKTELTYLAVGVGAQALQALRSGHVDGLAIFDSVYAQMEALGARLRYFVGEDQDKLFAVQFVMRRSAAESDPALATALGRAIAKATYFAQHNPEACVRMMFREVPSSRLAGMTEAEQLPTEIAILKRRLGLLVTPDSERLGFGAYNPQDVAAWDAFAVEGGIVDKPVSLEGAYTNRFVAGFNDFDRAALAARAAAWRE